MDVFLNIVLDKIHSVLVDILTSVLQVCTCSIPSLQAPFCLPLLWEYKDCFKI